MSDEPQPSSYRSHSEQYRWADRDFRKGDRVVFVGPPDDQYQAAVISSPGEHKLLGKTGTVLMGPSEDIRCYPEDPASDIIWIRFDDDKHLATGKLRMDRTGRRLPTGRHEPQLLL